MFCFLSCDALPKTNACKLHSTDAAQETVKTRSHGNNERKKELDCPPAFSHALA